MVYITVVKMRMFWKLPVFSTMNAAIWLPVNPANAHAESAIPCKEEMLPIPYTSESKVGKLLNPPP